MKVLMLSPEYPPHVVGGLGKHVYELAENLTQQGVEVYVVTPSYPGSPLQEEIKGVKIFRSPLCQVNPLGFLDNILQSNLNLAETAISLIHEVGGFSIIHAHDWLVGFSAKLLKHAFRLPLVCTIHATEYGRNRGIHNDLQNYIHNVEWLLTYEGWRVICCSEYMTKEVSRVFELPTDKIKVIPNGINPQKFAIRENVTNFRHNYAAPEEKIILSVGRLVHEKGLHTLIEALPKILSAVPEAKLVVVGKGGERESLEKRARDLGISHKVFFTGFLSDENLVRLYKCADVAVFPSLYEPFGIVALEGMAAQVPVVLSDTGGLSEIIVDEKEGLKAYPGDSWMLGEKIIAILKDKQFAANLVREAYTKVKKIYSWEQIARDTRNVYSEVEGEWKASSWSSAFSHNLKQE